MKPTKELDLKDFEAWNGAVPHLEFLCNNNLVDRLEFALEDVYQDAALSETELNDLLWFEPDLLAEWLGFEDWDSMVEELEGDE